MPNSNKTAVALIVDRSGSMTNVREETIRGINKFIADQKEVKGECEFTMVQFSTDYAFTYNATPIRMVAPLTPGQYVTDGYTALLDAVGRTIDQLGQRLDATPEAERPGRVIVAIITDGHENASKEFSHGEIHAKIKHQREKYGWEVLFLGADIDAVAVAGQLGIRGQAAMNYNKAKVGVAYASLSSNVSKGRADHAAQMDWSPADRKDNA